MSTAANSYEEFCVMIFDYSLAALVTAGLLIYLVYALLKPELF
jgi:K+-transporting ATPase KdpF subunit